MLTVKDFEKGQKAYIVTDDYGTRENKIFEATVKTVGRKYVTLDDSWGSRYQTCANNYLTEVVNCGWVRMLFATEQAAKDYIELKNLVLSINIKVRHSLDSRYSLDQLRQINEILEHPAKIKED